MERLFFTFGDDPGYPFGENAFVEVDGEDADQCLALFNLIHPPRDESGILNCAFWYAEKDFVPIYNKHYKYTKPVEVIGARINDQMAPRVLRVDEIKVGDLVWLDDHPEDLWRKCTGYAELADDGMQRRNRGTFVFYGCGHYKVLSVKDYGVEWRCWDKKPGLILRSFEPWRKEKGESLDEEGNN